MLYTVPKIYFSLIISLKKVVNRRENFEYLSLKTNETSEQDIENGMHRRVLLYPFLTQNHKSARSHKSAIKLKLFIFSYIYPTMDELANQISYVLTHFGIKQFIGFGVGAGSNILCRFALSHPNQVSALCLINCVSTQAGWIEWGYQKLNARYLRSKGMTQGVLEYLMWHHFGRVRIHY